MPPPPFFDTSSKNKIWHIFTNLHRYTVTKKIIQPASQWNTRLLRQFILYMKMTFQGYCIVEEQISYNAYSNNYTCTAKWHKMAALRHSYWGHTSSWFWTLVWHFWTSSFYKLTNYQLHKTQQGSVICKNLPQKNGCLEAKKICSLLLKTQCNVVNVFSRLALLQTACIKTSILGLVKNEISKKVSDKLTTTLTEQKV